MRHPLLLTSLALLSPSLAPTPPTKNPQRKEDSLCRIVSSTTKDSPYGRNQPLKQSIVYVALILFSLRLSTSANGNNPGEELPPVLDEDPLPPLTLIADGFDYPVGGGTATGFGITGYGFLDWSNYSQTWHPGEDWNYLWGSSQGKAVLSIAHGVVTESVWNTAQGNIIQSSTPTRWSQGLVPIRPPGRTVGERRGPGLPRSADWYHRGEPTTSSFPTCTLNYVR